MSVSTSPARRVLGEKDANTLLLPQQSPGKTKVDLELGSPRLRKTAFPLGSLQAGQKRKIQQVDEEEATESPNVNASHTLSQRTELLSDEERSGPEEGFYTSLAETRSTPTTVFTSFHQSQEEHPQLEAEFVILEEPSQQTLDKMVCLFTFTKVPWVLTDRPARRVIYAEHFTAHAAAAAEPGQRTVSSQPEYVESDRLRHQPLFPR